MSEKRDYPSILRELVEAHGLCKLSVGVVETEVIIDEAQDAGVPKEREFAVG